jgi:tetratricopeptide (TPR) repeat protein
VPAGWRWVRLTNAASLITLLATALLAGAALWMKGAEKDTDTVLRLLIVSAALTLVGLVTATAGKLFEQRHRRVELAAQWRAQVRRLLREYPNDMLPRLSQLTDAKLGTTPTRHTEDGTASYVPRPGPDARLREALPCTTAPYPFVLLVGDSKSGKSRTAVEAARKAFGELDPPVILARDGEAVAELTQLDPRLPIDPVPALVWLDDLSASDLNSLTGTVLDALAQQSAVVATITTARWNEVLHSSTGITAAARDALRRAVRVDVDFEPTEDERADFQRTYPDEELRGTIAETLVGGDVLLAKYQAGRQGHPAGCALVQAAVDVRRAGVTRPVTEPELRSLFPLYLRRVRIGLAPTTEQFTEGLRWAAEPVASQVALLRRTESPRGEVGWEALDYVVSADDGQRDHPFRAIPDELWLELPNLAPAVESFAIGFAASLRDLPEVAIRASRRAADSGDADIAPLAAVNLGLLLAESGDADGARAAYQKAIESGHAEAAPKAAVNLGLLFKQRGDSGSARTAYRAAIDSGHAGYVPIAAFNLGVLLADTGDADGALAAYGLAIDSGHAEAAPKAAVNIGLLLKQRGDLKGARLAYQTVIGFGAVDEAPTAAVNLGLLLAESGAADGALAAYRLAIDSGHADHAPKAAVNLGVLLAKSGDLDGALAAFRLAIESGHADHAPKAAANVGVLLKQGGDLEGARAAYQTAIDSGHADVAPAAAFNLGLLLTESGDANGALAAYRLAIDSGHAEAAPNAAVNLGVLLAKSGDLDGARAAFRLAIDSGHVDAGTRGLDALRLQGGDTQTDDGAGKQE